MKYTVTQNVGLDNGTNDIGTAHSGYIIPTFPHFGIDAIILFMRHAMTSKSSRSSGQLNIGVLANKQPIEYDMWLLDTIKQIGKKSVPNYQVIYVLRL